MTVGSDCLCAAACAAALATTDKLDSSRSTAAAASLACCAETVALASVQLDSTAPEEHTYHSSDDADHHPGLQLRAHSPEAMTRQPSAAASMCNHRHSSALQPLQSQKLRHSTMVLLLVPLVAAYNLAHALCQPATSYKCCILTGVCRCARILLRHVEDLAKIRLRGGSC